MYSRAALLSIITQTDFRIDARFIRRAVITLAAVGAYRLVQQVVTVPGFDPSVVAEFFGGSPAPAGLPEGWTIYRHLGGGDAVLLVDPAESERAGRVLRERGLPVLGVRSG